MKFSFQCIPSLPLLAWCARLRRGDDVVPVVHGPWVETRDDCFFEGAWDGPFAAYRFDESVTLAGSGGRLTQQGVIFAAPTHILERIQSVRAGDVLYISNSFACLLARIDDELDIRHATYFFDFLHHFRSGALPVEKYILTRRQRQVQLHDCCNILITPDLTIQRLAKNPGTPPANYTEYVSFLQKTVQDTVDNATHPDRTRSYRPVTAISQGYDSPSVAVLARQAGCREAVTFRKSRGPTGYEDDSGARIATILGYQTTEYERRDFSLLPDFPEAEFFMNPYVSADRPLAVMADQLAGSLLMTGRHGENYWTPDRICDTPLMQERTTTWMYGSSLGEFRLRTGFFHLPVPYSGAYHCRAIYHITQSREMRPWSVGGPYDRPIARRIIEEAGVPRSFFGQHKKGGGNSPLSPASEADFLAFYNTHLPEITLKPVSKNIFLQSGHLGYKGLCILIKKSGDWRFLGRLSDSSFTDRFHPLWRSKNLYLFHWGFSHTRERYAGIASLPEGSHHIESSKEEK